MADLGDAANRLENDQERLTRGQRLLGDQAGQVVTALGQLQVNGERGGAALRSLIGQLEGATGRSREAAAVFENTARGMKIFLEGTIQTIQILLGEMLAPVIKGLVFILRQISSAFLILIRRSPTLARLLSFMALGMTVLLIVGGALILVLAGIAIFMTQLIPLVTGGAAALAGLAAAASALAPFILPAIVILGGFISVMVEMILFVSALVVAYEKNLGGLRDFVTDWVLDLTFQWEALADFFAHNNISVEIVEQLTDRNLLVGVLFIIGMVRRIEEVWEGMLDVFRPIGEGIVIVFEFILETVIFLIDTLEELLVSMGIPFAENLDFWRTMGHVLGVLVVIGVVALIAVMGALTAVVVMLGVMMLISLAPVILATAGFVGLILVVIQLVTWIKQAASAIGSFLLPIFESIGEAIPGIVDVVVGFFSSLFESIRVAVSGFAGRISASISSIFDRVSGAVSDFFGRIGAFFSAFAEVMGTIWARLSAADAPWRRNMMILVNFIDNTVITPIQKAFTSLVTFVEDEAITPLRQAFSAFVSWLSVNVGEPVVRFFTTLGIAIRNAFVFLAGIVINNLLRVVGFFNAVGTVIFTGLEIIGGFIRDQAVRIGGFFAGLGIAVVAGIASIGSAISEQAGNVATFFSNLWGGITTTINEFITNSIAPVGRRIVETITTGLSESWGSLLDFISVNLIEVRDLLPGSDAVTGPLSDITASGSALITTFQSGAEAMFPGLVSSFESGLGGVLETLGIGVTAEGAGGGAGGAPAASPLANLVSSIGDLIPGGGEGVAEAVRNVTVTIGDINVSVQEATPEEAERLADMIITRIRELEEGETEATFA
jgi:hypothetical protein